MSDIEIMEFPYGAFLKLRLEFVLLRDNELEALIMRIIEGWMIDQKKEWMKACAQAASDGKPEPPEPDYFVTLSYAQIMAQLYMFNSSRKGAGKDVIDGKKNSIHRNTLTKAMAALIEDNYVITRPNPDKTKEYDATQYTLNLPLIQEHMKLLPKSPMSYLGSNGRIDGVPCPDFLNPPKEIPSTKFVNGGDAQKSCTPCTKKVHPLQQKSASPSTKKVHGDAQKSSHLIDIENRDTNRLLIEDSMCGDDSTPRPFVASATSTPSLSSQCLSEEMKPKAPSKKKTEEPKGPPVMPPADMEWGTTKCKMMFDAWRGHTLIAQYKIMEASKCAKGLAEQFTEEEVRRVYQAMSEDTYWKERGGPDICNVANNIDKELKKMKSGKEVKQSSCHGTTSSDGYTKEERLALLKMSSEDRKMYNQRRREARERAMEVQ